MIDNVLIHYYPASPYGIKCAVKMRNGKKVLFGFLMLDLDAVNNYFTRQEKIGNYIGITKKIITHKGE